MDNPFTLNTLCTTPYENPDTPAWADILAAPQNFVACRGKTTALCYYSGPDNSAAPKEEVPPTPCYLRESQDIADCTCFETPSYAYYFVDINAILNQDVYQATVKKCGVAGENCLPFGKLEAPVCGSIQRDELIPGADLISTFSLHLERQIPIARTKNNCTSPPDALYAGCMTAPCRRMSDYNPDDDYPLVHCACPTYEGPFQLGRQVSKRYPCDLTKTGNAWSAAYNTIGTGTIPTPPGCIPDQAVENGGCQLLPGPNFSVGDVKVPTNVNCKKVCQEYTNMREDGIQVGYTCDATLCTDPTNLPLVAEACGGLDVRKSSEIFKLEFEAGYSCAASQICGCKPNRMTNEKIKRLNQIQKKGKVKTQCDINNTLCGQSKGSKGGKGGKGGMMGGMMGMKRKVRIGGSSAGW